MDNMEHTVYEAPKSDLNAQNKIEIPEEITRKIKNGWLAAIVSGVFTLGITILAVNYGTMNELFDIWTSIDAILIFLLAFGIYKKSRIAATTMFVYFLLSKIWLIVETGKPNGIIFSLIFLYFYFQAMMGTFQYHQLFKTKEAHEPNESD